MKNKKIFKRLCLFIILPIIFGVLLFNLLPTNSKTAFACACGSPAFECYPDSGALADDPDIQDNVSPTSTDYNDPDYSLEKADIGSNSNNAFKNTGVKFEVITFIQNTLYNVSGFLHKLL